MGCGCVSQRQATLTASAPRSFLTNFTDDEFVRSLGTEELKERKLLLAYFHHQHEGHFQATPQLLELVRRRGVPPRFRWLVWRTLSGYSNVYRPGVYERMVQRDPDRRTVEAIAKDLDRTFPNVEDFDDEKKGQLASLLRAYASLFPEVGYCQGMNFVAGFLLIASKNGQEDAFFMLVQLMVKFRGNLLFCDGLPLLKLYTFQFRILLENLFPEVHRHFVQNNVTPELYATRWILTVFTQPLPFAAAARIWDLIFCDGLQTLVLIALANVKLLRSRLLRLPTEGVLELLSLRDDERPPCGGDLVRAALGLRLSGSPCGPGLEGRLSKLRAEWARAFPEEAAELGRSGLELCEAREAAPCCPRLSTQERPLPASSAQWLDVVPAPVHLPEEGGEDVEGLEDPRESPDVEDWSLAQETVDAAFAIGETPPPKQRQTSITDVGEEDTGRLVALASSPGSVIVVDRGPARGSLELVAGTSLQSTPLRGLFSSSLDGDCSPTLQAGCADASLGMETPETQGLSTSPPTLPAASSASASLGVATAEAEGLSSSSLDDDERSPP